MFLHCLQFLGIANNQICIHPQEVEDVINGIITKTDPVQLLLTLATISNTWSHSNIVAAGDSRFFYHYDLMYSLLNNDTPIHNKQFFENIFKFCAMPEPIILITQIYITVSPHGILFGITITNGCIQLIHTIYFNLFQLIQKNMAIFMD